MSVPTGTGIMMRNSVTVHQVQVVRSARHSGCNLKLRVGLMLLMVLPLAVVSATASSTPSVTSSASVSASPPPLQQRRPFQVTGTPTLASFGTFDYSINAAGPNPFWYGTVTVSTAGPFLVVSGNNELRVVNASFDPGFPELSYAAVGTPLDVTAYNGGTADGMPMQLSPRPGPAMADRLLVSHGSGGLVEYSIDATTGAITYLGKRISVANAGVADSGSMVCVSAHSPIHTVYCYNTGSGTWALVATVVLPTTDYYSWTLAPETDLPGPDYKVRLRATVYSCHGCTSLLQGCHPLRLAGPDKRHARESCFSVFSTF